MNYMITEKSERIIKRAIGWLILWDYAFQSKDKDKGAEESLAGIEALADEQLEQLEQWKINESVNGRR